MIETVMVFALVTAAFEAAILLKLSPRIRLRLLGSAFFVGMIHFSVILFNIIIHWGTITGSMTAVTAGLTTFATIPLVRRYSGYIRQKRYFPGAKRYDLAEIQ